MATPTKHFPLVEIQCKCGCGKMEFTQEFLDELEALRVEFGAAMEISSGYRCPAHNSEVSDTGDAGPHTLGAVDVKIQGAQAIKLLRIALNRGWIGVGVQQKPGGGRFLHLDRIKERIWSY